MAARFWVGGTGTWDNSDTTHWAATTGGAGGQSVPAATDTVTFDGSSGGGTVTVAATINGSNTVSSITMGAFTGTLTFPNTGTPTYTMNNFSGTGSGARILNLGTGTFVLTVANGTSPWDFGTITGLTLNCQTSTLHSSPASVSSSRQLNLGAALIYNNIVVTNPSTSPYEVIFGVGTAAVIANLTINGGVVFRASNAHTATIMTLNGTSLASPVTYVTSGSITWTTTTLTATYCILGNFRTNGAQSASNSLDLGGNTNVTITAPSGGGVIGVIGG
jgi:hypothetical protein